MTSALKKIYIIGTGMLMAVTAPLSGADCCPSSYCEPECSCDDQGCEFYLTGELLYWRPELCGLGAAFGSTTIATTVNGGIVTTTVIESDKEPHSKWDAGFRVGADALFDCFDLALDWTHFNGKATFSENAQYGRWNIKYDVIDLTLGRSFSVVPCFCLTPFIGLRGAIIHQSLHSHLNTLFTSPLIGSNTVFTDKNDKEDF